MHRSSHVVYDKTTGEIVHVHHVAVVPGATAPSDEDNEASAIKWATTVTRRNTQDVATISIDRSDMRRGHRYAVDISEKKLREQPGPKA
jgi:hypothetical protein